jgi:hypothetical protein
MTGEAALSFSLADIITTSVRVWLRNFFPFGLLSTLLIIPNTALFRVLGANVPMPGWATTAASMLGSMVMTSLVVGMVSLVVVRQLRGEAGSRLADMRGSLRFFPRLIVLSSMTSALIGLGTLCLFAPGMLLLMVWFVVEPAMVIEDLSMLQSLRRSVALTRGVRTEMLALTLGLFGLGMVATVAQVVFTIFLPAFHDPGFVLTWATTTSLSACVSAVTYHRLRQLKEGPDVVKLAAVFE